MRVMIVVTHLLGTGHLRRALNLALAFTRAQHSVTLVTGGMPVTQFHTGQMELVQLPPVRSDGVDFRRLLTADNQLVAKDYLLRRQCALIDTLKTCRPDVIITELFPFGRRILRAEFESMLHAALTLSVRPVVLASVRDILVAPSTREKALETERLVHKFYTGVLVHSKELTTPLTLSWPVSVELSRKLRYTGYVAQPIAASVSEIAARSDVVVSAGGGAVGSRLFEAAVAATAISSELSWKILVGGSNTTNEVRRLQAMINSHQRVTVESARPDFRQLLKHAKCSVSMCGYNTAIDLLQTGTPGVLVPFDDGGETEQRLRAESLSQHESFALLLMRDLSGQSLAQSVEQVILAGRFKPAVEGFDGAEESVRIATRLVRERTAQHTGSNPD